MNGGESKLAAATLMHIMSKDGLPRGLSERDVKVGRIYLQSVISLTLPFFKTILSACIDML